MPFNSAIHHLRWRPTRAGRAILLRSAPAREAEADLHNAEPIPPFAPRPVLRRIWLAPSTIGPARPAQWGLQWHRPALRWPLVLRGIRCAVGPRGARAPMLQVCAPP